MKALVSLDRHLTRDDLCLLECLGLDVDCISNEEETPVENPEQYDILIVGLLLKYTPIESFTNLKYIQLMTAGFDYLTSKMDYIREKGIVWHRAEGIHGAPIAEHAICGLLDIYRKRRFFDDAQRKHIWTHTAPGTSNGDFYECSGRRAAIIGAGMIGTEIAKRLKAFGCEVTGVARTAGPREGFDAVYATESLDDVLKTADIVILSLPNNSETRHIINAERIGLMKDDAVFINIARGALVDQQALIRALQAGKFKGAVLDVFEEEPLPADSPLWDMENVIITGHLAGHGDRKKERFVIRMEKNLKDFLNHNSVD